MARRLAALLALLAPALPQQPQPATCETGGTAVCGAEGEELFSETPLRGLHVLHVLPSAALPHCGAAACPMFELELFVDGKKELRAARRVTVECGATLDDVAGLLKAAVLGVREEPGGRSSRSPPQGSIARYELEVRAGRDRWAFYTPHGEPVRSVAGLLRCNRMLAFEGGLFLWPGVRVGFRRVVGTDPLFGTITLVTRSLRPLVFLVEPLLSEEECAHIIAVAEPELVASDISQFDDDLGKPATAWRRSQQARLANDRDPTVTRLNDRVAALLKLPRGHQEPLEVLRYQARSPFRSTFSNHSEFGLCSLAQASDARSNRNTSLGSQETDKLDAHW